ncbi:zinc transporter zip2-like protein [Dermatophagoides farinae]|uniref:Zinc transporter zip2-like protein n=1 Tax=Dermatophagoides farinae TaxID=6954 RepID=A0A9D4NWQ2_DERFA|nr:zinc transporter zip2-like protein [Dermatophagoides farinae]
MMMDIVETTEQSASDSNGIRLIAAGILFILTLIMGTIPVYILEFSTKYFGQSKNSNTLPVTNGSNHNIQSSSSLVIRQTTNKSKKRWFHHDRIVQFLTQIGGGVLFYTAFVHMLPEIRENYESYLNPDDGDHHHHHDNNTHITNITNIVNMTVMTIVGCGDCDEDSLPLVDMCACAGLFERSGSRQRRRRLSSSFRQCISGDKQNNYDGNNDNKSSIWPHIIDNFLLILAFSCHSIFDGISIGVQTKNDEIWTMLIAILSHKLLIAFILSFQIYEKCQEKITSSSSSSSMLIKQRPIKGAKLILWFFSTLFALMSPIGIIFIMIMNDASDAPSESSLHIIVLAAISAGTILYIVFFEIIDKTTSRLHLNGIAQWIALAIGFGLMHFISHLFHE